MTSQAVDGTIPNKSAKKESVMCSPGRGNKTMLFFLLYLLVFQVVIYLVPLAAGFEPGPLLLLALGQVFGLFVPFLFYLLFTRQKFRHVLLLTPLGPKNTLIVLLISIVIIPMVHLITYLLALVFHPMVFDAMITIAAAPLWASLLVIGVFPSLFEEFFIRGAIYKEYEEVSIRKRAVMTGLFFGIMHFNFHQSFYAFLFGILYAYLLYYTRSIFAPMLMHFVNNSLSVLMFRSTAFMEGYFELWGNQAMFLLIVGGLSLLMLPLLVVFLKELSSYHRENFLPAESPSKGAATAEKPKVLTWAFWPVLAIFLLSAGIIELGLRMGAAN